MPNFPLLSENVNFEKIFDVVWEFRVGTSSKKVESIGTDPEKSE